MAWQRQEEGRARQGKAKAGKARQSNNAMTSVEKIWPRRRISNQNKIYEVIVKSVLTCSMSFFISIHFISIPRLKILENLSIQQAYPEAEHWP